MKLVIAEKPSVARSIASVIGAYKEEKGYLEGNGYIVTWCFGHLAGFKLPNCNWTMDNLPLTFSYVLEPREDTKEQFNNIKALINRPDVTSLVEATDAGREGEAIFRYVYYAAKCNKPFERLWISSLTDEAIEEGFNNLRPSREYDSLYNAALARDFGDKIIGLNGTRLFSIAYNQFKPVLSVGRVQTPTLSLICEREEAIKNFVSKKYYKCHLIKVIDDKKLDAITENIDELEKATEIVNRCNGKNGYVKDVKVQTKTTSAPKLYDLTLLQRDCNKLFGYTAQQTLETVQALYEKKLCTYPRTDSNYITSDMEESVRELITIVRYNVDFLEDIEPDFDIKRVTNDKKVTDHHAILPTDEISSLDWDSLTEYQNNILTLICVRLYSATARKMTYEATTIKVVCEGTEFKANGKVIIDGGFYNIEEKYRLVKGLKKDKEEKEEEKEETDGLLPQVAKGEILENCESKLSEHNTKPPAHYTEESILLAMERAGTEDIEEEVERMGLGTTATRATILENLIDKGYLVREKKKLLPTERAFNLMKIVPEELKSAKLTSEMENTLAQVARGEVKGDVFLGRLNQLMNTIIDEYKSGKIKSDDSTSFNAANNTLGKCPNCGEDVVYGKNGAYCKGKCGMRLNMIRGKLLTDKQVKGLLKGETVLIKGLKKKDGSGTYEMNFKMTGIEDFSYVNKENVTVTGKQLTLEGSFPIQKKRKNTE